MKRLYIQVDLDLYENYLLFKHFNIFTRNFSFTAVVPENVPIGISVVNITATDPDEGLGGELKYDFLDEGEANGIMNFKYIMAHNNTM